MEPEIIKRIKKTFIKEPGLLKQAIVNNKVSSIDWEDLFVKIKTSFILTKRREKGDCKIKIDSQSFIYDKIQKSEIKKNVKELCWIFDKIGYNLENEIIYLSNGNYYRELKLRN